jgi:hypothetical protein
MTTYHSQMTTLDGLHCMPIPSICLLTAVCRVLHEVLKLSRLRDLSLIHLEIRYGAQLEGLMSYQVDNDAHHLPHLTRLMLTSSPFLPITFGHLSRLTSLKVTEATSVRQALCAVHAARLLLVVHVLHLLLGLQ